MLWVYDHSESEEHRAILDFLVYSNLYTHTHIHTLPFLFPLWKLCDFYKHISPQRS